MPQRLRQEEAPRSRFLVIFDTPILIVLLRRHRVFLLSSLTSPLTAEMIEREPTRKPGQIGLGVLEPGSSRVLLHDPKKDLLGHISSICFASNDSVGHAVDAFVEASYQVGKEGLRSSSVHRIQLASCANLRSGERNHRYLDLRRFPKK